MPGAATKRELIDRIMKGRLSEYLATRREADPPLSWARIVSDLRVDFDVEVSDESIKAWYAEDQRVRADRQAS